MDLLYDLQYDVFTRGHGGAFEAAIVAATWIFSATVLGWSWRHRDDLLAGD